MKPRSSTFVWIDHFPFLLVHQNEISFAAQPSTPQSRHLVAPVVRSRLNPTNPTKENDASGIGILLVKQGPAILFPCETVAPSLIVSHEGNFAR